MCIDLNREMRVEKWEEGRGGVGGEGWGGARKAKREDHIPLDVVKGGAKGPI